MDGTVYVYPQYRSPVTLLGHGPCLEPPTRCTTTGRSVCQIPFGAWKLDSARYSFDKHCLSTFCPPTIHRLSTAADAFHRSAAAAAAVAAAAVNGSGGGVATGGGGGNNSSSTSSNNNGTTNTSGSTVGTGSGGGNAISLADTASAAAACYNLHSSAAASVAAAVSGFIPTMSSHSGAHAGPHHHTSAGASPSLIQAAAAAAARQQSYLPDAKHPALTFTSPLSGAQKLLPSAEAFPSILPVFADSLSQLNYGRKVFPCPQCRYTTDRRNNLKRHMLTMHQACSKLLECCGILFTTKASLREHALIFHYHGYTCFYCGRRFCRKALLKRHLSVHNGQKDFVCSVCDYATSHKSNLERHRKVHVRQDSDGKDIPAGIICVGGSSSSNNVHNTSGSSSSSGSNSHHSHSHKKHTSHGASSSMPPGGHCTKTTSHSDDDDDDDDEDELLCVDSQHVEGRPHHLHRSHPDMKHEVNDSDDDVSICLDDEEVHVN